MYIVIILLQLRILIAEQVMRLLYLADSEFYLGYDKYHLIYHCTGKVAMATWLHG